jgi:hypothetical protein|tara:strand:+ start:11195 stop:11368 length:174 start_codon:yes stop_codon:yes gene_type:complete
MPELSPEDKKALEVMNPTHRYSEYLLGLRHNWAYEKKVPGRDAHERRLVRMKTTTNR